MPSLSDREGEVRMPYAIISRDNKVVALVQTKACATLIRTKGTKIVKVHAPCPTCGDTRGLCVQGGVTFVPPQRWGSRRSRRRSPRSK